MPRPAPNASGGSELVRRAGLDVVGSLGAAPAAVLGGALVLGVGTSAWSLDLEGRVDLPRERTQDGIGVRSSLVLGLVVPCMRLAPFVICPLAALGALRGEGIKVAEPRRDATFYSAFGLRAGLEAPLGGTLFARLHTEFLAPVTPTTLKVHGSTVWETPAASGSAGLGLMGCFR